MELRHDEKFTSYECVCLFTMSFLTPVFSEALPLLVRSLGPAAWLAQTFSMLLAFGYLGLFWLLFRRDNHMDFLVTCDQVYGKVFSRVIYLLLLGHLFLYMSSILSWCVETLQVYAYSQMSALSIDLLVLGAVAVIALYSIKGLAKTISILLPLVVLAIFFILIVSHGQYDIDLLNPVLGYGPIEIAKMSVYTISRFNAILILSLIGGSFHSKAQYRNTASIAIAIAGGIALAATLCYCMAIPYSNAEDIRVGIAGLAQGNWTGRYMQRLESIYLASNVLANIILIGYSFLLLTKLFCHIFTIRKSHARAVIVPLAVLTLCLTRIMANNDFIRSGIRNYARYYSVFFCIGILLLTLLVSALRRMGGKKARRVTAMLLIPCLCLGLFSGCSNAHEPDAEIYPIAIGYDKGVKEKYLITMKFMTENKSGTEESSSPQDGSSNSIGLPSDTMVFEAPTLSEGLHLLNALMPRRISLLHIRLLVISEELAREGIDDLISPIIKSNQFKPTMPIVISKCSAYDMIASKDAMLSASVQTDTELMMETVQESTSYLGMTLSQFLYRYNTSYGDAMAIYGNRNQNDFPKQEGSSQGQGQGQQQGQNQQGQSQQQGQNQQGQSQQQGQNTGQEGQSQEGGQQQSPFELFAQSPSSAKEGYIAGQLPVMGNRELELAGMAVFRGEKMAGVLNTNECQILALLNDSLVNTEVIFPDMAEPEKYYVTLNLRKSQGVKYSSHIDQKGVAHITVHASYKGLIGLAQNPETDYFGDPAQHEALRQYAEHILTQRGQSLIQKLQKEYGADVLQFGRQVSSHFLTIETWEAYDWSRRFPEAVIDVQFSIQT